MVVFYNIVPWCVVFWTWNIRFIPWALSVVLAPLVAEALKQVCEKTGFLPEWCRRPRNAKNCDVWNANGSQGDAPGFPSGHMATTAAFWMGATSLHPVLGAVGILATGGMAWARMKKDCHTFVQTFGGTVLGIGVSLSLHRIV